MSFGGHHTVPLCIVAALMGAHGWGNAAIAQTIAPPAVVQMDEAATATKKPATTDAAVAQTSEEKPAATIASSSPTDAADAAKPTDAPSDPVTTSATASSDAAPAEAPASSASTSPSTAPETATAAPVAEALTIDVVAALNRVPRLKSFEKRDRDGLVAAYKAREDRPIWMTAKGATPEAEKLAAEIAKAGDWGLEASAFDVPSLKSAAPDAPDLDMNALADAEVRLSLAALKYARYARGGRFAPTELTPFLDRKAPLYEPESVIEQIAKAAEPDAYLRKLHPQHRQFELLRQRYLAVRDEPDNRKGPSEAERLLANMEQWRWMPADLGAFHIWVNITEQLVRVVKDGRVIHTERIVVGKPNAQTPVFSHEMEHVIFYPFWGLPDSIKTNEILPGLQRGKAVLARQGLKLQLNGRDVDPSRYDWSRTDIRRFHVYQPPGQRNALGIVKFMFPNKHAVYMHDTPSKSLFKASTRAFSHGCMRVQNPLKFAELILAEDRGMTIEQIKALSRPGAPQNNQINLTQHIPVHMVYFTMWADESGKITSFKDIYGHEERIRLALAGKMHLIKPVPQSTVPTGPVGRLVEASPSGDSFFSSGFSPGSSSSSKPSAPRPEWARRMFSGNDSFAAGN